MEFDLLRRVRWRNLGRAAAAVALVGAVVAWPRLTPPEPQLPGSEPRPLVQGPPRERTAARREREERPRRDPVGQRKPPAAPPKRRQVRKARRETRSSRDLLPVEGSNLREDPPATQINPVTPPPAQAKRPAARPPVDPAQTEFGFEGG